MKKIIRNMFEYAKELEKEVTLYKHKEARNRLKDLRYYVNLHSICNIYKKENVKSNNKEINKKE